MTVSKHLSAVSKHQVFTMERMLRSKITPHPKNPRVITESAKKKLRKAMGSIGLLQPVIFNKRTGYLLGGHQRLSIMDGLEHYKLGVNDYYLDVSVVDIDEKSELEALVFLNNASASESWDTELLAELNIEQGISFDGMGFDALDVNLLFDGDSRFDEIFKDNIEVEETKVTLDEIKAARKDSKEIMDKKAEAEHYFIVVCRDDQEKADILTRMKCPKYERYISSEKIMAAIK